MSGAKLNVNVGIWLNLCGRKEKTSKFKQEQHIVSEQASLRCKKNIRKFEY